MQKYVKYMQKYVKTCEIYVKYEKMLSKHVKNIVKICRILSKHFSITDVRIEPPRGNYFFNCPNQKHSLSVLKHYIYIYKYIYIYSK